MLIPPCPCGKRYASYASDMMSSQPLPPRAHNPKRKTRLDRETGQGMKSLAQVEGCESPPRRRHAASADGPKRALHPAKGRSQPPRAFHESSGFVKQLTQLQRSRLKPHTRPAARKRTKQQYLTSGLRMLPQSLQADVPSACEASSLPEGALRYGLCSNIWQDGSEQISGGTDRGSLREEAGTVRQRRGYSPAGTL